MKPKKLSPLLSSFVLVASSIISTVNADQTWSGATSADWNTATNWTSAVPTGSDVAIFGATSTANLATTLSANSPVAGISVASPSAAVSISSTSTAISPSVAVTLANATDIFTYAPTTPFANGDRVTFTAGTLPTGMTAGATYFVINATATTFQISTTAGGAAVNLTADGATVVAHGVVLTDFTTDTFTCSSAVYSTPIPNGTIVSFNAQTMPAGVTNGGSYFVINSSGATFQVSNTFGGPATDFTVDGLSVRAFTNTSKQLAIGASGINMSAATQGLTINSPVIAGPAQTWAVNTGVTLTVNGVVGSANAITKSGAGTVTLTTANSIPGGISVTGGKLGVKTSLPLGGGTVTLATGTTFGYERNGSNSIFPGNPISVVAGSNVTITTDNTANGYSGLITGDAASTVNIGAVGALSQCSFSLGATTEQFGNFFGTVKIIDGGSIRFSSTSNVNNGGSNALWDTGLTGDIAARNAATVNLGSLIGTGTLSGSTGATGTTVFVVGARNENCVFGGVVKDATAGSRIAALTKTGTAKLTLTGLNTYGGATVVNGGTLEVNNVKSGTGSNTINNGGTLAGTSSLAGTTTVASGGHVAPGSSGIGNLTLSNLALSTGSVLDLQFGGGNDSITIPSGGSLTIGTGVSVDVGGFGTPGTYPIINYTGVIVPSGLTVLNGDPSKIYSFTSSGTAVSLVINASDPSNYWAVDGSGAWGTAANWSKNLVPNAPSALALLGPYVAGVNGNTFSAAPTITLDTVRTVGDLRFNDADTFVPFTVNTGTAGSLSMNNGSSPSSISVNFGAHSINAPVAVSSQGLIIDASNAITVGNSLTISGVVSGGSAVITKTGPGMAVLTGNNTYGGGTTLTGGILKIDDANGLGTAAANFAGGTLMLAADIATDARAYTITGANTATFDTNGFNYALTTGIAPLSGATGGLNKTGAGALTLNAAQTYTGATTVNGGELIIDAGGSITGGSINTATAASGSLVHVNNGGTINTTTGTLNAQTGGLFLDTTSGNVSFSGLLLAMNTTSNGNSSPIRVSGGILNAPTIQLGRTGLNTSGEPAAAPVNTNLYVSGGAVNVSGDLIVGTSGGSTAPGSSVVTRVDGGTLTVGGAISIGLNNGGRWSYLDINGGTLVNTGAVVDSGVVLGGALVGKAAFLMRAGTATVERIQFGRGAVDGQGLLKITGGDLYVGSGGIPIGTTGIYTSEIRVAGGNLAAKADWASPAPVTLGGGTINAADAASAAHNIALSGVVSGTDLIKAGGGKLTLSGANTYTGTTTVSAGILQIDGDNTLATGAVSVAAAATLGGNGSVGGAVSVDGSIAPGASTGTLTVASATFNTGSSLEIELDDASTPKTDKLVTTGALDITNAKLKLLPTGTLTQPVYIIARYDSLVGTAFSSITGLPSGATINYAYNNGVDSKNIAVLVPTSAYATWSTGFGSGFNGTNNGATQDPDADGISNVLEFVLGGNPLTSSTNKLPTAAIVGTNYVFTFKRSDASESEVTLKFQYGTNLTGWTPVTIGATNALSGPEVNIVENTTADDDITVTIPKGANTKLFGRLQAVKNP